MQKEYRYVIICLARELYVVTKACVERCLQFCTVHRKGKALEGCEEPVLADGLAMQALNRARSQFHVSLNLPLVTTLVSTMGLDMQESTTLPFI
jgi:hypothetical protein